MCIRPFRPDDLPAIKKITTEAFTGVSMDEGMEKVFGVINGHDWKWRKARHIDDDARRDSEGIFVAEIDGRVVGSICTYQDQEGGIGHIPNLSVHRDYRGRGLGRKLIAFALAHFRRCGLTHAKIETLVQNDVGNQLYRSFGFREVARQIHFLADLNESSPSEED